MDDFNFDPTVRLIFFDFDGVFNVISGENVTKTRSKQGMVGFEKHLIDNLNTLCESLPEDWKFIISSSWRMFGMGTCLQTLLEFGMDVKHLSRWTNMTGSSFSRGHEVSNFIDRFAAEVKFVVIDDESFDLIGDFQELTDEIRDLIKPKFIKTNSEVGFTMEKVEEVLRLTKI